MPSSFSSRPYPHPHLHSHPRRADSNRSKATPLTHRDTVATARLPPRSLIVFNMTIRVDGDDHGHHGHHGAAQGVRTAHKLPRLEPGEIMHGAFAWPTALLALASVATLCVAGYLGATDALPHPMVGVFLCAVSIFLSFTPVSSRAFRLTRWPRTVHGMTVPMVPQY